MRLSKSKKGIELSINFIVMLILALAVFAGGLMFAAKFFGQAEKVRSNLDAQTEKQIEKLLDSGSPVVLPISTKEIFRNKFDTFGLGILAKANGKYTVTVQQDGAFKKDKTAITTNFESWRQLPVDSLNLKKNEKGKMLIGVQVPKTVDSGTYLFKITVAFESENTAEFPNMPEYDKPLQMIVKVP
jgi:uncharacterized membrane protein